MSELLLIAGLYVAILVVLAFIGEGYEARRDAKRRNHR